MLRRILQLDETESRNSKPETASDVPPILLDGTPFQIDVDTIADGYGNYRGRGADQKHGSVTPKTANKRDDPGDLELRTKAWISHQQFNTRGKVDHTVCI